MAFRDINPQGPGTDIISCIRSFHHLLSSFSCHSKEQRWIEQVNFGIFHHIF